MNAATVHRAIDRSVSLAVELARPMVHSSRFLLPAVLVLVVVVPLTGHAARRLGGRPWAAVGAVLALGAILDLTVLRPGLLHAQANWTGALAACAITDPDHWGLEALLNVAMFVPLGAFAVLAAGRRIPLGVSIPVVVLGCAALSVGIELSQAAYAIGRCDTSDVVHNTLGAAIGALLTPLVLAVETGFGGGNRSTPPDMSKPTPVPTAKPGFDGQAKWGVRR